MSGRGTQLSSQKTARLLRFTRQGGDVTRAYMIAPQREEWTCVSTKSAELTVVLDGEVSIEIGPRRQVIRARAGEAFLLPRAEPHRLLVERASRLLIFDATSPVEVAPGGPRLMAGRAAPKQIVRLLDRMWNQRASECAGALTAARGELLAAMNARDPLVVEGVQSTRRVTQAKAILEATAADPPSIKALAASLKVSDFYLLREFKRHFAFTPLAYVQFLRVEHFVWELMARGRARSILAQSSEAGFGDYATFNRRVHRLFDCAPSKLLDVDGQLAIGPARA